MTVESVFHLTAPEQDPAIKRMLALSVLLHLGVLLLIGSTRLMPKGDQPLSAYQVSLVTLSVPASRPTPPPPVQSKPEPAPSKSVEAPVASKPVQTAKLAARPSAIKPAPVPPPSVAKRSGSQIRDLLRGIELPPDVPQLGDLPRETAPTARVNPSRNDPVPQKFRKDLERLNVPEAVAPTVSQEVAPKQPASSLAKQFESFRAEQAARAKTARPMQDHEPAKPAPTAAERPPAQPVPAVNMRVPGASAGFDPYWAKVQRKISSQWVAPPVDLSGRFLQAVISFRIDRSGVVSRVIVERTSGNGYYDDAARRAVLSVDRLPPFPPELSGQSQDVHFIFTVGQEAG
ncbi:MAG: TonB family protein [Nitrospirota bacterium]